jgi:2-polyprenyl-3-methyl-5-hydroxy-6-metoxy-1,4-benzoquinol methylase
LRCPICQSDKTKKLYDLRKISGKEYDLLKCKNCSVKFLYPLPSTAHQKKYYNDPLYQESKYFVHMKRDYKGSREYKIFDRGTALIDSGTKGKVLDIGCSSGVFLDMMRTKGWDVAGVELCGEFVKLARELFGLENIFNGTLEEARFEDESFDLITMWDLVEHVPDPSSLLLEAERILKPTGLLLILTPDENSLIKYLTNMSYRITLGHFRLPVSVIYDEHHLFYFNLRSLDYALKNAGLRLTTRMKESTALDRILGPDSDHWLKKKKLMTAAIRFLFSLSKVFGLQNKLLVIVQKKQLKLTLESNVFEILL